MSARLHRFVRFGLVGVLGFVVDAGITQGLFSLLGLPALAARVPAFLAAVAVTWWCNRHFTFGLAGVAPRLAEFLNFLGSALAAGAVNYACFAAMVLWTPAADWPALAVAVGSVAGWVVNFTIADRFVFRRRPKG